MIIHFIHCNTDTLRAGSRLFLVGLRARWVRIHNALWHRINRHFARRLRQRTAYFRSLQGQAAGPNGDPRWHAGGNISNPSRIA
jgi:hypothetical protein